MSETPIIVRTTTRVPATYEDVHEDWTPEKIRECFGDDPSCIVVPLLEVLETAQSDLAAALAERDALAARVAEAEADARRWRFVRGKVSRILNERTLKMDGLRVEVYYDEPQAFLIVPTDNGALFDEAIDAGMSREEKS